MPLETVRIKQEDVTNEPELITVEIEPKIYPEPKLKELVKQEPVWDQDESEGGYVEPEINEKVLPGTVTDNRSKVKVKVEHVKGGVVEREEDTSCDEDEDVQSNQKDVRSAASNGIHIVSHACPVCCTSLPSAFSLAMHIRVHTKTTNGQTFTYKKETTNRIHNSEKSFPCSRCDKQFTNKSNLSTHERIHTNRTFDCDICQKKFTHRNHLDSHRRVHTGEKPFVCKICHKQFTQKPHLNAHVRIHTGEKPYACKICEKRFTKAGDIRRHERIHTGERPYSCDLCERRFVQKQHMTDHMNYKRCAKKPEG
ncbi:zinc finger protein 271-like isoform X2 [Cydia pomonella]|uniref:zinc finger protein 271-like isoform X2 n=1 Tax=Cydia pomonella TaxID=82600 RepID=UPI002ADDF224|nr:zinc finger protein 271-like isoform X2 [Cydia pomonella]